ncbi:hypothetical protein Pmani_012312 [Petrolisthes manimaculis]|uniref:Uncharacterized protein n=1 Tax=Petrolisthes manimaculis TaxID=1843537 RepID=A0AAE1Q0R4_9EUCA|nr:hypothetical protein Pmani_012312 [Petrolisthes manimaculis]
MTAGGTVTRNGGDDALASSISTAGSVRVVSSRQAEGDAVESGAPVDGGDSGAGVVPQGSGESTPATLAAAGGSPAVAGAGAGAGAGGALAVGGAGVGRGSGSPRPGSILPGAIRRDTRSARKK